MSRPITGECPLCRRSRVLCKSHIIPHVLYKPIRKSQPNDTRTLYCRGLRKPKRAPKGIYEYLLCSDCEKFLGREYEDYFAKIWFHPGILPKTVPEKQEFICINVDFNKFKLFHLSIVWRAGVAKNEAFKRVSLGQRHEEKIRSMLRSGNAGSANDYPIVGICLMKPGLDRNVLFEFISTPISSMIQGHRTYRLAFGGCWWTYFISSHSAKVAANSLSVDGDLILGVSHVTAIQPIDNFMQKYE
jgi:hypothetical protein